MATKLYLRFTVLAIEGGEERGPVQEDTAEAAAKAEQLTLLLVIMALLLLQWFLKNSRSSLSKVRGEKVSCDLAVSYPVHATRARMQGHYFPVEL